MKVLYLDTETTGIDPVKNAIIQIAGIVEIDGKEMEEFKFNCQPFNGDRVEPAALEVNGLTVEQIKAFPNPDVVYRGLVKILLKYIDRYNKNDKFTLAGQKVRFDADFLKAFFEKCGDKFYGSFFNWRHVDLMGFVRVLNYAGLLKTENDKLATLATRFVIPLRAHDALEDIRATKKILRILIDDYLLCKVAPDKWNGVHKPLK